MFITIILLSSLFILIALFKMHNKNFLTRDLLGTYLLWNFYLYLSYEVQFDKHLPLNLKIKSLITPSESISAQKPQFYSFNFIYTYVHVFVICMIVMFSYFLYTLPGIKISYKKKSSIFRVLTDIPYFISLQNLCGSTYK